MGTITLNLPKETEEKFRKAVALKFGRGKGSLGKAATEALETWSEQEGNSDVAKMLELMERGFYLGKRLYKTRAELHER
ncbi:MAG TPA: hypothetical protein HA252_01835 [Candidatus Diapherotrites archaeon]|uniref:XACb0070 ribbon-helix-helix domain-containing protein n=1 Tax=Candidatus Iainarchaeum sp. TaxID=3101447 RepID=A0A7J4JFP1_9ARCH|nr:hypothetical protein [Candidatus Diapherotrites archaeon]HIH16124.1 hypothetical protein [Candidatus Diapherotrites archaeon]